VVRTIETVDFCRRFLQTKLSGKKSAFASKDYPAGTNIASPSKNRIQMKILTQVGFACSLALTVPVVQAATPLFVLDVANNSSNFIGGELSLSFSFSLNDNYSVSAIGLIDVGALTWADSGFKATHLVSLLDSANNVIASATFSPTSNGTIGPGTYLPTNTSYAQFRYLDITPVTLMSGNYKFVTTYPATTTNSNQFLPDSDFFLIRPLTELSSTSANNFDGLRSVVGSYSNLGSGTPGSIFISANALLDPVSVSAVPEPSEFAMMIIGLGVIGAMARRRRSQSV
jgi:hypothetical protein